METVMELQEIDSELESWLEGGLPAEPTENYGFLKRIRASGLSGHYQKYFDPFQLQSALEAASRSIPPEAPIMVEFDMASGFRSRIYTVALPADGRALKKNWRHLRLAAASVDGFSGIPKDEAPEVLKNPAAWHALSKGLFLLCATCTHRAFEHWPRSVFISLSGQPMAAKVI